MLKRGLALTPVKFGISFTTTLLNQAGALVHVYTDGSVHLNHGGTEMGQGLYIKVAQVVAEEFEVDLDRVRITATTTDKVPNTSATAASSGTDLNGMAALDAARAIKARLIDFAAEHCRSCRRSRSSSCRTGCASATSEIAVRGSWSAAPTWPASRSRPPASTRRPKIHWDRAAGTRPAVLLLRLRRGLQRGGGRHADRRDTGCGASTSCTTSAQSLNPAIDIGQIEGGFVQGMGWLTTEELCWDDAGPAAHARALDLQDPRPAATGRASSTSRCWRTRPTARTTIYRSKAVGEPPLMLAISVLHALSDAVASVAGHRICPRLDAPATPERVLDAIERCVARRPAERPP